jgi:hypothetical protein
MEAYIKNKNDMFLIFLVKDIFNNTKSSVSINLSKRIAECKYCKKRVKSTEAVFMLNVHWLPLKIASIKAGGEKFTQKEIEYIHEKKLREDLTVDTYYCGCRGWD